MKVIPVIDVLNGRVVHAKGGIRNQYQPLNSSLFLSNFPLNLVIKFEEMGFKKIYLADLDSILNRQTNFRLFEKIKNNSKIELFVDAGVSDKNFASQLFKSNVKKVIIGTETLKSMNFLKDMVNFFGNNKIIVSLDLIENKILNNFDLKEKYNPMQFLYTLEKFGISEVIVLDLTRVGSRKGFNHQFSKKILEEFDLNFIFGGGIRDISDIVQLRELGAYGVLIGTSLYSNIIDVSELKQKGFL